jgi:hypothetical protein
MSPRQRPLTQRAKEDCMHPNIVNRRHWTLTGSVVLCVALGLPIGRQPMTASGGTYDLRTVLTLSAGNRPEGIAVHPTGLVFVGNRRVGGPVTGNEILRISPDGTTTVFATLPSSVAGTEGLLGLAVDPGGDVYAAFASFDDNHGVWRVSRDGTSLERLPGSSSIVFPNGLAFDRNGSLYVSDSFGGAIWRSETGAPFTRWVEDPLLLPLPTDPFGIPLPGANGLAFEAPDTLYVANTEQGLIARVRIERDGGSGAVEAVTMPFAVPTVDGIAMDIRGHIYAVIPGFSLLQSSPLVKVDPRSGAVNPVVTDPVAAGSFDTPLSVAFGAGQWGARTVLVTNGDLPVVSGGAGPGVVQLDVGVPGNAGDRRPSALPDRDRVASGYRGRTSATPGFTRTSAPTSMTIRSSPISTRPR